MTDVIDERFSLLTVTEGWQLQSVDNNNISYRKRRKKIMKKKMVTVLLTAAMVTAMAAGCGKSSDSGSDKKESYTPSELSSLQSMVLLITAEKVS